MTLSIHLLVNSAGRLDGRTDTHVRICVWKRGVIKTPRQTVGGHKIKVMSRWACQLSSRAWSIWPCRWPLTREGYGFLGISLKAWLGSDNDNGRQGGFLFQFTISQTLLKSDDTLVDCRFEIKQAKSQQTRHSCNQAGQQQQQHRPAETCVSKWVSYVIKALKIS